MLMGFYKRNVTLLGAPLQVVKHKSQLDTLLRKSLTFVTIEGLQELLYCVPISESWNIW